jgi:hypothetical protein
MASQAENARDEVEDFFLTRSATIATRLGFTLADNTGLRFNVVRNRIGASRVFFWRDTVKVAAIEFFPSSANQLRIRTVKYVAPHVLNETRQIVNAATVDPSQVFTAFRAAAGV